MNKIQIAVGGLVLLIGLGVFAYFGNKGESSVKQASSQKKLLVTASFYPLAYLAERIGGEYVTVTTLTPAGAEPHDFEPSAKDIAELENQNLILLNGGGIEGYERQLTDKKNRIILVGERVIQIKNDPHVWLDPVLYSQEVDIVTSALIQADPQHERELKAQSEKLKAELESLHTEFMNGLQNCKQKNIITSHSAFSYLAKRYGLVQIPLSGLTPEDEPSVQTLGNVATFAKKNNIKYIFFESLVSPKIAETIAREVGAQTLVLNPLEGLTKEDMIKGKDYASIQRENLKNLRMALECDVETGLKPVSTNSE